MVNRHLQYGIIGTLLLFFLIGNSLAVESPADVIYVQGGESTIVEEGNETYLVTVKEIIPYLHITDGLNGTSALTPVEMLDSLTYPLNAALVFSGEDKESSSMVEIVNLSLSDENKILTGKITLRTFYKGDSFPSFAQDCGDFSPDIGEKSKQIGIYLEIPTFPPTNGNYVIFDPDTPKIHT